MLKKQALLYVIMTLLLLNGCIRRVKTDSHFFIDSEKIFVINEGKARRFEKDKNDKLILIEELPIEALEDWLIISKGNYFKEYRKAIK